jgi:predicted phosphatase
MKDSKEARTEWIEGDQERKVEQVLHDVEAKNKARLDNAKIVPLSPDWEFCTNGLYLFLATAGSGKSRFIIKHIMMADKVVPEGGYYSLICYCSTSGEMDETVQSHLESNNIKTPLVQIEDNNLMDFLARHLKRKKKYYSMIKYIRSQGKTISDTLRNSINKHNLKIFVPVKVQNVPNVNYSMKSAENPLVLEERINKPKLISWICKKIDSYGVSRAICPLLVILDDFAGHKLIERKETPLAKMMTKCGHYSTTFIIAVQTPKYVIKNIRRQATDCVIWQGVSEEDFIQLFKEIPYSYNVLDLWERYRKLPTQTSHLILNIKAHLYRFVVVNVS